MLSKAIVRKPGKSLVNGLTRAGLGKPEYERAIEQHEMYVAALTKCGLDVERLEADEAFPDSTFVEDTALLTPRCAIITNPGAESRKGETREMKKVIRSYYTDIGEIQPPGTVEAGDIMMVGNHYYVGLSGRTNKAGAEQLIHLLEQYGMRGTVIKLNNVLHLKTGVAYLEKNNLVVSGEFLSHPEFSKFNRIEVPEEEAYAANSVWINGNVLVPKGYPKTSQHIKDAGYAVIELDMSEYRKLDGGLSCLSLRF